MFLKLLLISKAKKKKESFYCKIVAIQFNSFLTNALQNPILNNFGADNINTLMIFMFTFGNTVITISRLIAKRF